MSAPTFGAAVTQGAESPADENMTFVQPAGSHFVVAVAENPGSASPPTISGSGWSVLAANTASYVDYYLWGRNGGAGETVTIGLVAAQTVIVGASFNNARSDWLTASKLVAPNSSGVVSGAGFSVTTGTMPPDPLLLSWLLASDNSTAISGTVAPSGMTLAAQVNAQFFFRYGAIAHQTPPSTASRTLTWSIPNAATDHPGLDIVSIALAVPGPVGPPTVEVSGPVSMLWPDRIDLVVESTNATSFSTTLTSKPAESTAPIGDATTINPYFIPDTYGTFTFRTVATGPGGTQESTHSVLVVPQLVRKKGTRQVPARLRRAFPA